MFGIFRFALAVLVASSHLGGTGAHGSMAVHGFFVVSGYLMTLVLNRTYRFETGRFWLNRFLRLFPPYYFVCAVTLVVLWIWPTQAADYHQAFKISTRPIDILGVLTMFPFPFYDAQFRPVPPTWSVGVELVMYFALFAFVARRAAFAGVCAALALAYVVAAHWPGMHLDKVGSLPAALLPFSLGALIYFAGDRCQLPPRISLGAVMALAGVWVLNLWACAVGADPDFTFYLNLCLCTALVAVLAHHQTNSRRLRTFDKILGDLAYPLFLVHWVVGFLISLATGRDLHARGLSLFFPTLLVSLVISAGILLLIDGPIQKIRRKVRPAA
jgi:peptidoglycan/LPS O-acetylase OafA/YrhL